MLEAVQVSDDHGAGSALCFIHELGWAVVAAGSKNDPGFAAPLSFLVRCIGMAGSKLGLAEIYPPAADSSCVERVLA